MRYYELDKEEQGELEDIENALEKVSYKTALDLQKRKELLQSYARTTLNKTKNINIRLSERDVNRLKAKAIEEGIPYQTLASSILHKATSK